MSKEPKLTIKEYTDPFPKVRAQIKAMQKEFKQKDKIEKE